jgi:hypothetical protein
LLRRSNFGRTLGALSGVECDEVALFAATMFHDYAFGHIDELEGGAHERVR